MILQAFTPERLEQNDFPSRHEFTSALRGGKNQFKDEAEYQEYKEMVHERYGANSFWSLLFIYAIADVEVSINLTSLRILEMRLSKIVRCCSYNPNGSRMWVNLSFSVSVQSVNVLKHQSSGYSIANVLKRGDSCLFSYAYNSIFNLT